MENIYLMQNNDSVCFITRINKLSPIENADNIELADIKGWTSVVQKNIYKENDLVLCITTDAIIPEELATKWNVINYLRKGNRVRTIKLRGVYSECILIPIFDIEEANQEEYFEGEDMMSDLKIFKYQPPEKNVQLASGKTIKWQENPNFPIYYKFPNQKNVPNMFNENNEVVITRKIHGTNARYGIVKKQKLSFIDKIRRFFGNKLVEWEYVYGSHNVQKMNNSQGFYDTNVWKTIAEKHNIETKLWKLFNNISCKQGLVIYGEIYGKGIQGEKYSYGLSDIDFAGFDIKIDNEYVNDSLKNLYFGGAYLALPQVECLYRGNWSKQAQETYLYETIPGTKIPHEGIVVGCITGNRTKISKVINPNYLIYSEKNDVPDGH